MPARVNPRGFKTKTCYSIKELGRRMNMEPQALDRLFKKCDPPIVLVHGKIWICDIERSMPKMFDSWVTLEHQRELARDRLLSEELDEAPDPE